MYIVENELLEEIIKNIIKYINELDLITKDKDKTFFFNDTNEFNKVINRVIKIVNVYQRYVRKLKINIPISTGI